MADIDIRPVAVDERVAAGQTIRASLLHAPLTAEWVERRADSWDDADSLAAWDGDRCVGHVAAFRFQLTVPGGARLPTAGVTRVGVLPTHTRRGLLRQMMERLLRDGRDRGQVVATLMASEAPIYERFGFGHATDGVAALVTTDQALPLRGPSAAGSVRLLRRDELHDTIPALYDRCADGRAGMLSRPPWMWQIYLEDVANPTEEWGKKGREVAVHTDADGVDDAYVHYEVGWVDGFGENPAADGTIHELVGVDARAERAMWDYVLDIDLIGRWRAPMRPPDDPIRRAFHDVRAYETRQRIDEQWLRLLDVDVALGARSYGDTSGSVVVEVTDPLFEPNRGRWAISADGAERTDRAADLTVDVATISAAYLGAVSWRGLADSGELDGDVGTDALDVLDALFAVRPVPFCGTDY